MYHPMNFKVLAECPNDPCENQTCSMYHTDEEKEAFVKQKEKFKAPDSMWTEANEAIKNIQVDHNQIRKNYQNSRNVNSYGSKQNGYSNNFSDGENEEILGNNLDRRNYQKNLNPQSCNEVYLNGNYNNYDQNENLLNPNNNKAQNQNQQQKNNQKKGRKGNSRNSLSKSKEKEYDEHIHNQNRGTGPNSRAINKSKSKENRNGGPNNNLKGGKSQKSDKNVICNKITKDQIKFFYHTEVNMREDI